MRGRGPTKRPEPGSVVSVPLSEVPSVPPVAVPSVPLFATPSPSPPSACGTWSVSLSGSVAPCPSGIGLSSATPAGPSTWVNATSFSDPGLPRAGISVAPSGASGKLAAELALSSSPGAGAALRPWVRP